MSVLLIISAIVEYELIVRFLPTKKTGLLLTYLSDLSIS